MSSNPVLQGVAGFYIWLFRGTPLLLQLLLWFNLALVFPTIGIPGLAAWRTVDIMTPFVATLLGLGLNQGAYTAEVVRAGIHPVKLPSGGKAREVLVELQNRLVSPPPWLAQIMGVPSASLARFEEDIEAEESA